MYYSRILPSTLILILLLALIPLPLVNTITGSANVIIIDSLPYTITSPGVYIIQENLSAIDGDGIRIESRNVLLVGNGHSITGGGNGTGIYIEDSYNVSISDLEIKGFDTGIYLNIIIAPLAWINKITIQDTRIGVFINGTNSWFEYGRINIDNVHIINATEYGIHCYNSHSLIARNLIVIGNGLSDTGIYIYESSGILLNNITIIGMGRDAIRTVRSNSIAVMHSTLKDNGASGLKLTWSNHVLIFNSIISENGEDGVRDYLSEYIEITANTITNNSARGINITGYYYEWGHGKGPGVSWIRYNNITGNTGDGVYIGPYSNGPYLEYNNIRENNGIGVYAEWPNWFYVRFNNIKGNQQGDAIDLGGTGVWENNYWGNYNGTGTYNFTSNYDPSPLPGPIPDYKITMLTSDSNRIVGSGNITLSIASSDVDYDYPTRVNIYWSGPPSFMETSFTWITVNPESAAKISSGEIVENFTDCVLISEGDTASGYIVYKLPWNLSIYGFNYSYIIAYTNGFVELSNHPEASFNPDSLPDSFAEEYTTEYGEEDIVRLGATTIFAFTAVTNVSDYFGVFNTGDAVIVSFSGEVIDTDWNTSGALSYQIIILRNNTIIVSIREQDIPENMLGTGHTGFYIKPLGLDISIEKRLEPYTSYKLDTRLHYIKSLNITLESQRQTNINITWNPPEFLRDTEIILWAEIEPGDLDINPLNNVIYTAPIRIEIPSQTIPNETTTQTSYTTQTATPSTTSDTSTTYHETYTETIPATNLSTTTELEQSENNYLKHIGIIGALILALLLIAYMYYNRRL